jgi:hypothetical protein
MFFADSVPVIRKELMLLPPEIQVTKSDAETKNKVKVRAPTTLRPAFQPTQDPPILFTFT